jgi:Coenzyme PQQ synthesis protein D (PqqD)
MSIPSVTISPLPHTINAPDVVAEDFDGQTIVLNLANGHYYSLDGCGADIWNLISTGYAPDSILASICDADLAIYEDSVVFINKLIEQDLIRPEEGTAQKTEAVTTSWSNNPPHLKIYDDLAELIYADPIHDVDENVGWPAPPREK